MRKRTKKETTSKNKRLFILIGILSVFLVSAGILVFSNLNQKESVQFEHIHGLGYSSNGESLVVPAHDGLRIYQKNNWEKSENEANDYMGFSMTKSGFYSSGHPAPNSKLRNPFGIIKSDNSGSKVEPLALYGEVDFHGMAAGYFSDAIYVINASPNSIMKSPGLYYSVDEAQNWNQSKVENLSGQASTISVHPTDSKMVVMGTDEGAYISKDSGNRFENVIKGEPVSSTAFTFNDKLLVGSIEKNKAKISVVDLNSNVKEELPLPKLNKDEFITFIASNPEKVNEISVSTSNNNIFLTRNLGEKWETIVQKGKGIQSK